jgi:hypothetical protein
VEYNGAKSAGTVPAVFRAFQRNLGGARVVLELPKLNLALKRLLKRSKMF